MNTTHVMPKPAAEDVSEAAPPKHTKRKSSPKVGDAEAVRSSFEKGKFPYAHKLARKTYKAEKAKLQAELLKVQLWAQETGQKFVILMEGRDAAGKGGTIKRFMEHFNPRYARVVALTKPGEKEKGQWFSQRYLEHLPTSGEIMFF